MSSKVSVKPVRDGSVFSVFRQSAAEKRFSRRSRHQRKSQGLQVLKASHQRIVLLEAFSKAKAWINRNPFSAHAGQHGRFHPFPQFALDQQDDIAGRRQTMPLFWTPRSEEHTSELQSHLNLVCRLLLEKKKN